MAPKKTQQKGVERGRAGGVGESDGLARSTRAEWSDSSRDSSSSLGWCRLCTGGDEELDSFLQKVRSGGGVRMGPRRCRVVDRDRLLLAFRIFTLTGRAKVRRDLGDLTSLSLLVLAVFVPLVVVRSRSLQIQPNKFSNDQAAGYFLVAFLLALVPACQTTTKRH